VVPLNVTLPLPWLEPKFEPDMVTVVPTVPDVGERLEMLGAATTVKLTPLLATPPAAVTTTLPVVAPDGTTAVMLLALQLEIVAVFPLKATLPLPWLGPKFDPAITTDAPTAPVLGVKLLMLGAAVTVKETPLLVPPPLPLTVTTTFPVVAPLGTVAVMLVELKLVMVADLPLKVTVALDLLEPKLLPAITMDELTAPVFGVRLVIVGAVANASPLHARNIDITDSRRCFICPPPCCLDAMGTGPPGLTHKRQLSRPCLASPKLLSYNWKYVPNRRLPKTTPHGPPSHRRQRTKSEPRVL
jgi:hypothetical protein